MGVLKTIWALALALAMPLAGAGGMALVAVPAAAQSHGCGADYYRNTEGHCVHRPVPSNSVPQGATAQCRDGTYSFSENHRGTCSYHGGVSRWL